uniref:S2 n=1 Tax=anatid alphaherpesvirus 1 TaxID=104388 RepID=E7D241_9ALPH|nr:S2 [Anatid alphaherpesvirus 1]ADU04081.1 S2 [Anatid alphaherpesvirus 1]
MRIKTESQFETIAYQKAASHSRAIVYEKGGRVVGGSRTPTTRPPYRYVLNGRSVCTALTVWTKWARVPLFIVSKRLQTTPTYRTRTVRTLVSNNIL